MRKLLGKLVMVQVMCAALAGVATANETPRFKSSGFWESLDLFANQRENFDATESREPRLKVDFAFRGEPAEREPGFLYLEEANDSGPVRPVNVSDISRSFTPRLSALDGLDRNRDLLGKSRTSASFTPRNSGGEVTISFLPQNAKEHQNSIDLTISSDFLVERTVGLSAPTDFYGLTPYDRRSSNLGLSIGYNGFTLGAALNREVGGLLANISGVDVGFGYEGSSFSTQISVGEYSRSNRFHNALVGEKDDFYKLELGAAYAVSERLRVSGGVRFFDYGHRFISDLESADNSGLLYLGTRFNF